MSAQQNRVVRVFIASSDELKSEREAFDTLFAHLNSIFKVRGVMLETVKWEFLDSSAGSMHKQEEYNRELKTCDICVVMFWQKFGDYTKAELDVAYDELCAGRKPNKLYIFFKEPAEVSTEMQAFKSAFDKNYSYGHFYGKFATLDKLQLDFILQLEHFLGSSLLKVENSQVKIDQIVVAHLDNIPFAADNEHYIELRDQLKELNEDIEDLESSVTLSAAKEERLSKKRQKRNEIEKRLQEHEQFLLGAAVRVARFTGERISERMKRAIELFNEGKVSQANTLLDEAERDADQILCGIQELKSVGRESVDELLVKVSCTLADERYFIDKRISSAESLYKKALELAHECDYEQKKLHRLLSDYFDFLSKYGRGKESLVIALQGLELSERLFGEKSAEVATCYNEVANAYLDLADYNQALVYFTKGLTIHEKVLGADHLSTVISCNNVGSAYDYLGDSESALVHYFKALEGCKKILGVEHPDTATLYNNIAGVYSRLGQLNDALDYYLDSLEVRAKTLGFDHPHTALSYNNIACVYDKTGDHTKALELYLKALKTREKVLGIEHPYTAQSYNNVGCVYSRIGDYSKSIEYLSRALDIMQMIYPEDHPLLLECRQNLDTVRISIDNKVK